MEIILHGFDAPTIAPDVYELKAQVLAKAAKIKKVTSLPSEEMAVEALTGVQRVIRGTEKARKEAKQKFLEGGRAVDEVAENFVSDAIRAESTLKGLLGEFAELKRQEALEAERLRQIEIEKEKQARRQEEARLQAAAEAQARAEMEAERLRLAIANSKSVAEKAKAEQERFNAQFEVEQQAKILAQAAEEAQKRTEIIETSVPITTDKARGAVTKFKLMYRVDNIDELFASHPHVCEITEKKSAVNMLINGLQMVNPDVLPKVPGLHIWREADVNTRSR